MYLVSCGPFSCSSPSLILGTESQPKRILAFAAGSLGGAGWTGHVTEPINLDFEVDLGAGCVDGLDA